MNSVLQSLVYLLCFATSAICTGLLARRFRATGVRLLLWTASCFALLALNNLLVVVDLLILPDWDLRPLRQATALAAVAVLLFGFVWEAE